MIIKRLYLKNFRNYKNISIDFCNGLNILIGNNAQGKTNILESIYVLALTKSFLGICDKNLINFDDICTIVEGEVESRSDIFRLKIKINDVEKRVYFNSKEVSRLKDYISKFNVIIFSPDDIRMIKDGPSFRRKYLNIQLSQVLNIYVEKMNKLNKLLKIRNEVLKSGNVDRNYLDIIDDQYCSLTIEVVNDRNNYINKLNNYIGDIFFDLSSFSGLSIKYISNVKFSSFSDEDKLLMLNNLSLSYDKDIRFGNTSIGVHRDDFHFFLDNKDISLYGSQGQLRMAILSLKLAEIEVFKEMTGDYPVLLLDDVFSELDISKRNNLVRYINRDIQSIITTTDLKNIDSNLYNNATIYNIKDGNLDNDMEMNYDG